MTIEFIVDHKDEIADDAGITQLIGWVTGTVETKPGNYRVRDLGGPIPRALKIGPRKGYLAPDGHIYKDDTLAEPFSLIANDPAFNLRELTYRFDFDLTTLLGVPVSIPFCRGPAPSTATTLYLARLMNDLDQPVIEVRTKGYTQDLLDAGSQTARDALVVPSEFDPRLDDTRVPTPGSVTLDTFTESIAAFLAFFSGADPNVVRIGQDPDAENPASSIEFWTDGVRRSRILEDGTHVVNADLTLFADTGFARTLFINRAAGNTGEIQFQTAGVNRWGLRVLGNSEAGGDAGSPLQIRSAHDDGTQKTIVVSIDRATDAITLLGLLTTLASATGTAGFRLPHGTAPTSPVNGDEWTTISGRFTRINGLTEQMMTVNDGWLRDALTTGESTIPRRAIVSSTVASGSQNLRLTYFTARKSETITQVRVPTGGTAAVGPTLCRVGIYSIDGSGNLTLIASTANDTNLWIASSTSYTKALQASFNTVRGTRYAIGLLVVGASTYPTFLGQNVLTSAEAGIDPRLGGIWGGQSDLPSSVSVGSITDQAHQAYVVLLP